MEWNKSSTFTILALGCFGAILAFIAEAKKRTASDIKPDATGQCLYPPTPSMALGLAATVFILATQIAANVFGGCVCCEQRYGEQLNPQIGIAIACLIFSWLTCANGALLLLSAATISSQRLQVTRISDGCYVLKPGIFAAGAVLSIVTASIGIIYNIKAASARKMLRSSLTSQIVAIDPSGAGSQFSHATQPITDVIVSEQQYYANQVFTGLDQQYNTDLTVGRIIPHQGLK